MKRLQEKLKWHLEKRVHNSSERFLVRFFSLIILQKFFYTQKKYLGSLISQPTFFSWFLSSYGTLNNFNHLGNTYSPGRYLSHSQRLEREVIEWNKRIIGAEAEVEGYVTSGGTEANLFLMWAGRDLLHKLQKPILLCTDFSHYSITKSARILGLETYPVKVEPHNVGMSAQSLRKLILNKYSDGQKSFLVALTIGYSSTGTSDNYQEILRTLDKLRAKYPALQFFTWIDASAQGLPNSFLQHEFRPLEHSLVQGYIVDFHKLGRTSLPTGVLLYKPVVRKQVETGINYLTETDATLLGSRPGSSALAIWANTARIKDADWKKHFKRLEAKKKAMIRLIKLSFPEAKIFSEAHSLTFAVKIDENFTLLSKQVRDKYALVECNVAGFKHYKFQVRL